MTDKESYTGGYVHTAAPHSFSHFSGPPAHVPLPQNYRFSWVVEPRMGPHESTVQTASSSVQPFLHRPRLCATHRQTETSAAIGCIHARSVRDTAYNHWTMPRKWSSILFLHCILLYRTLPVMSVYFSMDRPSVNRS